MRTGAERKGVTTRTACASGKRTNSARRGIRKRHRRAVVAAVIRAYRREVRSSTLAEFDLARGGSALRQGELGTHDRLSNTGNFDATGRA